jgi:glycosyltransferase A (GT-A) superfamily protein (DUF2064 family)
LRTKVLFYAPGNEEGLTIMMDILQSLKLDDKWTLLPAMSLTTELLSCNIGTVLADALQRTRAALLLRNNNNHHHDNSSSVVVFLGMDAPELPLEEIITALAHPTLSVLCPASDGGYGMLSVPSHAPCPQIFQNISWSQSLTAVSQLKALTDCNVNVRLGRLMEDIDNPEDVTKLARRLSSCRAAAPSSGEASEGNNNTNVLWRSSGLSSRRHVTPTTTTGICQHTWDALVSIGLIERKSVVDGGVPKYGIREDTFTQQRLQT